MVVAFFLHVAWQAISCVLMAPVVLIGLSAILKNQGVLTCLDLQNYGENHTIVCVENCRCRFDSGICIESNLVKPTTWGQAEMLADYRGVYEVKYEASRNCIFKTNYPIIAS